MITGVKTDNVPDFREFIQFLKHLYKYHMKKAQYHFLFDNASHVI